MNDEIKKKAEEKYPTVKGWSGLGNNKAKQDAYIKIATETIASITWDVNELMKWEDEIKILHDREPLVEERINWMKQNIKLK